VILAGRLLAQAAMKAGKEVTFMPSYGAEVRGGTANCTVVISESRIACPVVDRADSVIAMNNASLEKFGPRVKPGGLLVFNSSLIAQPPNLSEAIEVLAVPANELAGELGNIRAANMVALGAYLELRAVLSPEAVVQSLPDVLAKRYHDMLAVNIEAIRSGAEFARKKQKATV